MDRFIRDDIRPEYVMENYEDLIYHDNRVDTEPEFCAFMRRIWVFNRRMKWVDDGLDGCVICYSEAGDLRLTGRGQASAWHSDPENAFEEYDGFTRFIKKTTKRKRDCAVLPAFQFHTGQHPEVGLTVSDAAGDWQFCIFIKGRSGPPVICSGWKSGICTLTFDVAAELKKRGYDLQFAELHFVMGIWSENSEAQTSVTFSLQLPGQPALVSCLPVVRTAAGAMENGAPVAAVVLDKDGGRLCAGNVKVYALLDGNRIPLIEEDGIWKTRIKSFKPGDYRIKLETEGVIQISGFMDIRMTDGKFYSYSKESRSPVLDGNITGPLSGSYQGMVFFKDVGLDTEKMINGQKEWDSWNRTLPPGEHWHYWEALTEKELDVRFGYLKNCGWDLLHLCQHWGIWERLDAGGRISPHGAEQLALYYRVAARHGLAVIQALSHYPYGMPDQVEPEHLTVPFSKYFDAGFKAGDWTDINNQFTGIFHGYLRHFAYLFKDETALLAMTASGEGDYKAGTGRVNDTHDFIKTLDNNHLFLAEPIFQLLKFPRDYCKGLRQDMFGSRVYWIGEEILPEYDLGLEFKFMQFGHVFMGEGSWPFPPRYAEFHGSDNSWCGTLRYRTRLRDSIYLGLIHRIPAILTWDEQIAEDERIVFDEVRRTIDWNQNFMAPRIAVRVNESHIAGEGRKLLAEYEKAFTSVPLAYGLIPQDTDNPDFGGPEVIIDACRPFEIPRYQSEGGILPDSFKKYVPMQLSEGYSASYLWSEDRQTFIAYVYNCTNHTQAKHELAGKFHRVPETVELKLVLQNFPGGKLNYRIYDLNDRIMVKHGLLDEKPDLNLGSTASDYFVVVVRK